VVLLLAESHFPNKLKDMPDELVRLVNEENISIHWCDDDLKSPLKYFYAFREYSNALIITIDDNLLCHKQLIETLYVSWLFYPEAVSTARAHLILISASGEMLSFRLMPAEVDACVGKPSLQMVATNCAGALYPTKLFFKVLNLLDAKADIENKLELLEATKADIMKSLELTKQKAERAEKDKQNSMEELRNIKNGWSFKIGRVLTFLPRIIRDWMKS
jgi:hypothetical protein